MINLLHKECISTVEMAQVMNLFIVQHEHLSLEFHYLLESYIQWHASGTPVLGDGDRGGQVLGANWPARLPEQVSSSFSERTHLKNEMKTY